MHVAPVGKVPNAGKDHDGESVLLAHVIETLVMVSSLEADSERRRRYKRQ